VARLLLAAVAFALASSPLGAFAHPLVDEAQAKYEEADFEGALDALTRAEAGDGLTRADLVAVYELRILVHLGIGEDEAVGTDLRRLISIAPGHEFSDALPPEVLRRASQVREELGGQIAVNVRASPTTTGVTLAAEVTRDPENLTREIRIVSRRGDDAWQTTRGDSLELSGDEEVEYYGEAVGPGGVVLATHGTESHPRTWGEGGGSPWLWIGIGAGAAAVVALTIVIIAVATSGGGDQTSPTLPMISFE
jgi:hypothetical protein